MNITALDSRPNSSFKDGVQFATGSTLTEQKKVRHLLNNVSIQENGCWICNLAPNAKGYANISLGRARKERAHRFIYETLFGKLTPNLVVMHTCDIRNCINPAHLKAGTVADNQRDMADKNRVYRGGSPTKFVRNADALELYKAGKSLSEIAAIQGIAKTTAAYRIKKALGHV